MQRAAAVLHRLLEAITVALLVSLAVVVVSAVVARYVFNSSFHWYDEVASVMLAWLTYYGAALAALRRSHLGFSGLVLGLPRGARVPVFLAAEAVVYAVFLSIAYAGWYVLRVMAGETLVSLDRVPLQFTQAVVPIGCLLFVLCQGLSTPEAWRRLQAGHDAEALEIEAEIERATADRPRQGPAA